MKDFLYQKLIQEFGTRGIKDYIIDSEIINNLNPKFVLRTYQKEALQNFLLCWDQYRESKVDNRYSFHMATGSGKTLIMASLILHFFKHGYRNFIFFVNSNNIISKTKSNFLDKNSSKYLFSEEINVDHSIVEIKESKILTEDISSINIIFTTIQGLHMDMNNPSEDNLDYDSFVDNRTVLISDESHHINADTKKRNKRDNIELIETPSWENTVEKVYSANSDNILLEFSATLDLDNDEIKNKYIDSIIFDYPLKRFREDGFSKEIKTVQFDTEIKLYSLLAILINHLRKKIFEKNRINIKPVILFKSKTIKDNETNYEEIINSILELTPDKLEKLIKEFSDENQYIKSLLNYLKKNKITYISLLKEIQDDFSGEKTLLVDSKNINPTKQLELNNLELNRYRMIFAVDQLNEGWDVLNLFDIVRLYSTRDGKDNKPGKTTINESQLIGRGARYCPFILDNDEDQFIRKFDGDLSHEMRICEELLYYSSHNPKYISELTSALINIGIIESDTVSRPLRLKDSFKESKLYKSGHIFLNKIVDCPDEEIEDFSKAKIAGTYEHRIKTLKSATHRILDDDENLSTESINTKTVKFSYDDIEKEVKYKAVAIKSKFYNFDNLKIHFPKLKSIKDFLFSKDYLSQINLQVKINAEMTTELSQDHKLDVMLKILDDIEEKLSEKVERKKGSNDFEPAMIKQIFGKEKILNFKKNDSGQDIGKSMASVIESQYHLPLDNIDWYAHNDCYGTSEEKKLILFIDSIMHKLKDNFDQITLFRNERHFKIYNFDDGKAFEPDFLLIMTKEQQSQINLQIFIEPKGEHLLEKDKWKEEFLIMLKSQAKVEQLFENKSYIIWGMPFYNKKTEDNFRKIFSESLQIVD